LFIIHRQSVFFSNIGKLTFRYLLTVALIT